VSLQRVDARFLLPAAPRTAVVLGPLDGWREGLAAAGVELRDEGSADLVIATPDRVDDALALGPEMLIAEGGAAVRPLRKSRLSVDRYLARPSLERPQVVIPLDQPDAARYATAHWAATGDAWRRVRNRLADAAFATRTFPTLASVTAVAAREPRAPAVLQAAERHGMRARAWLLTPGRGDDLSRNVFHLFADESRAPAWVVKFARVSGYRDPFDRDEAGLTLAHDAGPQVAERAPKLLARFTVDGLEAAVETAAHGERLTRVFAHSSKSRALQATASVAGWIAEIGKTTRGEPGALSDERIRLRDEVLPHWSANEELVNGLPEVPAVLQHNDMGPWNIVLDDTSFTVVDWESARRFGLPLWDLVYFLTEALAGEDRVADRDRDEYTVKLFRGLLPSSATMFEWIRRAVHAAEIPPEAVGRIVTLCWLHHGLSHVRRGEAMDRAVGSGDRLLPAAERIAPLWLREPDLGAGWDRWRD
jgi:hypothetical protein